MWCCKLSISNLARIYWMKSLCSLCVHGSDLCSERCWCLGFISLFGSCVYVEYATLSAALSCSHDRLHGCCSATNMSSAGWNSFITLMYIRVPFLWPQFNMCRLILPGWLKRCKEAIYVHSSVLWYCWLGNQNGIRLVKTVKILLQQSSKVLPCAPSLVLTPEKNSSCIPL